MTYYKMKDYPFIRFEKSNTPNKMYDAILLNTKTNNTIKVPFGSVNYENYQDKTGLNLYPHLIHGDNNRRKSFRARHKGFLKKGHYSPSFFSFYFLW